MTIADVSTAGYVDPIKQGVSYRNNLSSKQPSNFIIGAQYVDFTDYMIGGMWIYNMYGFTTQLAEQTDILNIEYSRKCIIWRERYVFRKIKKEFLYGIVRRKIQWYYVSLMSPERAFIEYVRERALQPVNDFVEICIQLDANSLKKMTQKYPLKNIQKKIFQIQQLCILQK